MLFINFPSIFGRLDQRWTLQRSMVRALELAELEVAQNLGVKKDKSLPNIQLAIEMMIIGKTNKRTLVALVLVFGCNLKKSA